MMTNRSSTDVSVDRDVRRPHHRLSLGLAFVGLVLVGLTQTGCRSNGCSNCGLGSRLNNGVQALTSRVMHHKDKGGCTTCGTLGSGQEGVIIDSGIPVVGPGAVGVPAPGTIVPAPSIESESPRLEALPGPAGAASPTSSNRTSAGASRSAYEASNRRSGTIASKRGSDLSRAYGTSVPAPAAYAPEEPDVFDHLPPVDLPADLSRKATPIEPTLMNPSKPADQDPPADQPGSPPPVVPATALNLPASPAEPDSVGDQRVTDKLRPNSPPVARATPGMARSASVAPLVAGGSLPSDDGLAWLKEKGYRTLVDLRPRSEVTPAFPDQVNDYGMLYVALPFSISPINLSRLTRFNDLMSQKEQRPIYFCDGDGRRAGLIWYLRLRSQEREETNLAQSKAAEIGLLPGDVNEAERFLKLNFALEPPATPTIEIAKIPDAPVPAPPQVPPIADLIPTQPKIVWSQAGPTSSTYPIDRMTSWRPVAALVLSGLGVPLAYWSGSSLLQKRTPRRASLTAKGPGPRKSLPASGA